MAEGKQLKFVIVGNNLGFPFGKGATNYIRRFSRAFIAEGAKVRILHLNCSERPPEIKNKETNGCYEGIEFEYTTGTTVLVQSFLHRRWLQIKGLLCGLLRLKQLRANGELDCVYIYQWDVIYNCILITFCRFLKTPVILDISEWWPALANFSIIERKLFFGYILKKADGAIAISEYIFYKLKEFYEKNKLNVPILKIPILIDLDELTIPAQQMNAADKYLLWYGGLMPDTRIIQFLMKVMAELLRSGYNIKLRLSGGFTPEVLEQLRQCQHSLNLPLDRIEFLEYLSFEDLKRQAAGAIALLMPLENTERDIARFPTRLGEYLFSGRPVVASKVGEVAYFLKDGINAVVCEAEDPASFAHGIEKLFNSPQYADEIGNAGKEFAKTTFDYRLYSRKLMSFVNKIIEATHQ